MDNELIIRAWKNLELDDNELGGAVGGRQSQLVLTVARPVIVESTTPETRWK